MKIRFTKMQGCGNDYVYINGFTEKVPQEKKPEFVRFASDRHFGIGGDGVIFITRMARGQRCVETASAALRSTCMTRG